MVSNLIGLACLLPWQQNNSIYSLCLCNMLFNTTTTYGPARKDISSTSMSLCAAAAVFFFSLHQMTFSLNVDHNFFAFFSLTTLVLADDDDDDKTLFFF